VALEGQTPADGPRVRGGHRSGGATPRESGDRTDTRSVWDARSVRDRSDLDLVAGMADASEDAYAELYRRHSGPVTSVVRMILMRDSRCEDVVAEVFVSLWLFPEKFDPARGTLLAYLRLKARGRSIDIVRAEAARTRRETADRPERPDHGADVALLGAEAASAVRAALGRLPADQRVPIYLAYYAGLTHRQVAIRLNLPEGTVKGRIRAGLSRLHDNDVLKSLRGVDDHRVEE